MLKTIKPVFIFFILFCFFGRISYGQYTYGQYRFVRGTCVPGGKHHPTRYEYVVNGKSYNANSDLPRGVSGNSVIWKTQFRCKGPLNYLIGYDTLVPDSGRVYYNKPYFNSDIDTRFISASIGIVTYLGTHFCIYQFMGNKKNGEPVLARQVMSAKDTIRFNLKIGAKFRVTYLNKKPEVAILHYDQALPDSIVKYTEPFLSRPNGIEVSLGVQAISLNNTAFNNYLKANNQLPRSNVEPLISFGVNQYFKSGLWYGLGISGGAGFLALSAGGGYLQKISKHYSINCSVHFVGDEYTIPSFVNPELSAITSPSQFVYSNRVLNPRIELMRRKTQNNVWGCQFLKIGAGAYFALNPNNAWTYQVGSTTKDSKGNTSVHYYDAQILKNLPPLPASLFYVSLTYSFLNFLKQ